MVLAKRAVAGVIFTTFSLLSCILWNRRRKYSINNIPNLLKTARQGLAGAIGNTPLIRINSLSEATGCEVLAKAEFLNPGGSVKDRVAVKIIEEALESGQLAEGGVITEGSAGTTAISLATVAPVYGCKCHVVIPDDAAIEKSQILEALGATVQRVKPVSISHPEHYVNIARRIAAEKNNPTGRHPISEKEKPNQKRNHGSVLFADQFENLANYRSHYEGTGPEIWKQTNGKLHAFVSAAGTGGTIAGISRFLKEKDPGVKCFLIDPPGSSLFNKVTRGVMYTEEEGEGRRLRNPFDTITEGIGINRMTRNFDMALLDGAFRGTDLEAVEMSRFILENDGLFVGSSSAMNCVGALKVARAIGPGHVVVTILCDSGMRHLSKFYNPDYLSRQSLTPKASGHLDFVT